MVAEQNRKARSPRAEGRISRTSFYLRQSVFVSAAQGEEVGAVGLKTDVPSVAEHLLSNPALSMH